MFTRSKRQREEKETEYLVEAILQHKGRKHIQFLVKWEGFATKENTWEPLQGLKDVDLLHDYLKKYSLSHLLNKYEEVDHRTVKQFFETFDKGRKTKQYINTFQHYKVARGIIDKWIDRMGKEQVLRAIRAKFCTFATAEYAIYVGFSFESEVSYLRMLASTAERICQEVNFESKQNTK